MFWKEFTKKAASLGDMGITAAWLPRSFLSFRGCPFVDQLPRTAPTKASSQEGNGYDIYDLYDLVSLAEGSDIDSPS